MGDIIRVTLNNTRAKTARLRAISRLLAESPARPISIVFDTRRAEQLNDAHACAHSVFIDEIVLWRENIGRRHVESIELHYHQSSLPNYEITHLIHCAACEFFTYQCVSKVRMSPEESSVSLLALLKGLGFSECVFELEINQSGTIDMYSLNRACDTARNFGFSAIGVELSYRCEKNDSYHPAMLIRHIKRKLTVDCVTVHTGLDLNDNGSKEPSDRIEIGPGALSKIANRYFRSFADNDNYLSILSQGHLPLIETSSPAM